MQRMSTIDLMGLFYMVSPFFQGSLKKIGIVPLVIKRKEYKTALDPLTNAKFSNEARENYSSLAESVRSFLLGIISEERNIEQKNLANLLSAASYESLGAKERNLIDQVGSWDDVKKAISDHDQKKIVNIDRLKLKNPRSNARSPQVAVVDFSETINNASAKGFKEAINQCIKDPKVGAIVLNLDSGGGGAVASETMRHYIVKAKERGKYVIASMSNACASGGYMVACEANRILALPTTITGSIGVVAGLFRFYPLLQKIGVSTDRIKADDALPPVYSFFLEEDSKEHQIVMRNIEKEIDVSYEYFVSLVAKSRNKTFEEAEKIAKGKVFSGLQAKEIGLVDEIGTLQDAIMQARNHIALKQNVPISSVPVLSPSFGFRKIIKRFKRFSGCKASLS